MSRSHLVLMGLFFAGVMFDAGCSQAENRDPYFSIPVHVESMMTLNIQQGVGVSGLGRDPTGGFFAMPERNRVLLKFDLDRQNNRLKTTVLPLRYFPKGYDAESFAWISSKRFAIGTEKHRRRAQQDKILLGQVDHGVAIIESSISLNYAMFDMMGNYNQGIEALCVAGDNMFGGVESVVEKSSKRLAPVAMYQLKNKKWVPWWLELTSKKGKLSSLACCPNEDHQSVTLVGIERHYGIARLLWYSIDLRAREKSVFRPYAVGELTDKFEKLPNLEGVEWLDSRRLVLINDNHTGFNTGPTKLFVIRVEEKADAAQGRGRHRRLPSDGR